MERKNNNMTKSIKKYCSYLRKDVIYVIIALVLATCSAVITIIGPDKIGKIANIIKDGITTNIDISEITKIGITLVLMYSFAALFQFLQQYIMATITLNLSYKMRKDLSSKINSVPQKYFNQTKQGDILSLITNDVSQVQQGLTNSLPTIFSAVTQFVGCLIMMFKTEYRMTLLAILITLIGFIIIFLIMGKSQRFFKEKQTSLGKVNGFIEEYYSGLDIIKINKAEKNICDQFDKLNYDLYQANWKSQFFSGIMQPLMNIISNISYVGVCVLGSVLALNNKIEFGVIVSFIFYIRLFTSPLTQIAQSLTNLQASYAALNRIFGFLDTEELENEDYKKNEIKNLLGNVEFNNVKFSYPDNLDKIIINNFNAQIKEGQKVAIVGHTGAGKTTIVNLLMRFYEISSGEIKVDGVNIKDLKREDVHNMFSMVLQDTWVFNGTVRENLVYNMENVSDEKINEVLKVCGIDKFVNSLPEKLDTVLTDNIQISAGQKQLLTIARAMIQNSPMLILDEATSQVDTRTELLIQNAMDELTKNKTSFIIAHRLSTIKNADLILVMDNGDIIEKGTHLELLSKNGFYATLYNSQFDVIDK